MALGWPWPMCGWLVSLLITAPVSGQREHTHALVADLERESAEYLIVQRWAGGHTGWKSRLGLAAAHTFSELRSRRV